MDRHEMALVVGRHRDVVYLLSGMGIGGQVFVPVGDPPHRSYQVMGCERNQQLLNDQDALLTKAAANVDRLDSDVVHPKTDRLGNVIAYPVRRLRCRPDGQSARERILLGEQSAGFNRSTDISLGRERLVDDDRRVRDRLRGVTLAVAHVYTDVVFLATQHQRCARGRSFFEVDHGRQFFVVDVNQLDGVLGQIPRLGNNHDDRLAHITHLVAGQNRGRLHLVDRPEFRDTRRHPHLLRVHERLDAVDNIRRFIHRDDTRHRSRRRCIKPHDPGVGIGAT